MQIRLIFGLLFISSILVGQEGLINFQPKFFTLRNSRIQVGFNVDGVYPTSSSSGGEESSLLIFNGKNSDLFIAENISNQISYLSAGLMFDLYSPNSFLGLTFGGNFEIYNFGIRTNFINVQNYYSEYNAFDTKLFGGVKLQIGKIYNSTNVILLPAINYSPLEGNLSYSGMVGLQYRFIKDKIEQENVTKIWVFLKGELVESLPEADENTIVTVLNDNDIQLLKLSLGFSFFF